MSIAAPHSDESQLKIAIIGLAGRFPGARDIDRFWQNLRGGVESISHFSHDEVESSLVRNPAYVRAHGAIEDVDLFDASFFGITAREAEVMDPQQRLFLECAWQALEDAGYDSQSYKGRVGIYAGVSTSSYLWNNLYPNRSVLNTVGELQLLSGNDKDFLAPRASYNLDLDGPSMVVQTACSSSLVAVHVACQSLLGGECDMALAGGVSIRVPQKSGYLFQQGGILSPDGHCRTFDAAARGTVPGSGVGIVVLKLLENAITDGDEIHAVILGSAVNNDGSLRAGFTAPSVDGQEKVIRAAQTVAGAEAESIGYVEAHGTATTLGDPIEVEALTRAFRRSTAAKGFCALGSVKSNIGHLDAAAGVAGLIKTVLVLEHKLLPPTLHYQQPNPEIDFANSPFYVNSQLAAWPEHKAPARAGVSSFGIGGTNAHCILEEAPARTERREGGRAWQLLVLSAKTAAALQQQSNNLRGYLQQDDELNLADVAYTLQVGRRSLKYRRVVLCRELPQAQRELEREESSVSQERGVAFLFPGQAAQYGTMGRELYESEPVFRSEVERCAEILRRELGLQLNEVLYGSAAQTVELRQTLLAQPALFVTAYALAKLWRHWGIEPRALLGLSIGEYVAACLAGVFSLEEGLRLVARRAQLMQQAGAGAMLLAPLPEAEVQELLQGSLGVAVVNGPRLCVVSGAVEEVQALQQQLAVRGVHSHRLPTEHAFHSALLEPILEPFRAAVAEVKLQPPKVPYLSNVTGSWITVAEATDADYWVRHLRQTVRFGPAVAELCKTDLLLLEVGPGQTLSTLLKGQGRMVLPSLPAPESGMSDSQCVMQTLGQLWQAGVPVQWDKLHEQEQRRRLPLPTYPFQRQRYWIEPQQELSKTATPIQQHADENPTSNLSKRIAALMPEQRKLLTEVLKSRGLDIPASAQGLTASKPDPKGSNHGP